MSGAARSATDRRPGAASGRQSGRAVSLPHEHGGYLTVLGATVAGVALADARGAALAVGVATAAAFFARAPIEQLARRRAAHFDAPLAAALVVVAAGAAAVAGGWRALAALAPAVAVVLASALARRARVGRKVWFEAAGMAALGASAGLIAVVGGADLTRGAALAVVFGVHAGVAVPLVRAEVRPRERERARDAGELALVVLAGAFVALVSLGAAWWAVALVPRALHAAARALTPPPPRARPTLVGLRETALLALAIVLLVLSRAA